VGKGGKGNSQTTLEKRGKKVLFTKGFTSKASLERGKKIIPQGAQGEGENFTRKNDSVENKEICNRGEKKKKKKAFLLQRGGNQRCIEVTGAKASEGPGGKKNCTVLKKGKKKIQQWFTGQRGRERDLKPKIMKKKRDSSPSIQEQAKKDFRTKRGEREGTFRGEGKKAA